MATDVIRGSAACYSSGTSGRAIVQIKSNHLVTDDPSEPSSYYHGPGRSTRLTRTVPLHITGETMLPMGPLLVSRDPSRRWPAAE